MAEKQSGFQAPEGYLEVALVTQAKDSLTNTAPNGLGAHNWLCFCSFPECFRLKEEQIFIFTK